MARPWVNYMKNIRRFCNNATKTSIGFKQMNYQVPPKEYKWTPGNLIDEHFTFATGHACLVLNREITLPPHVVYNLWQKANIRCTVDGGTNHWRDYVHTHFGMTDKDSGAELDVFPPDVITGDFDSITQETVDYYSATPKIHTPDQNATDFTKAVSVLQPVMEQRKIQDLIVFHDISGRFDQVMANMNTLYKMQKEKFNVHLISGNSITWLLRPGKHSIKIPNDLVARQCWCALMPVGEPARNVTTTGLKWNLYHALMEFGGMVSTSNTYADELVEIETNSSLIWSMGAYEFDDVEKPDIAKSTTKR